MNLLQHSLRRNVFLLLCAVGAAFAVLVLGWNLFEHERARSLVEGKRHDFERMVASILELRSRPLEAFVNDYTFWDDMADYVAAPSEDWARENLDVAASTYKVDGVFVFDMSGKQVYGFPDSIENRIAELPVNPSRFAGLFTAGPIAHFFARSGSMCVEVFGATIHRSADAERTGKEFGYFFGLKRWDPTVVASIGTLTESNAVVLDPLEYRKRIAEIEAAGDATRPTALSLVRPLLGADGGTVGVLEIEKSQPAMEISARATSRAVVALFSCVLVALVALALGLYWFFDRPLTAVINALRVRAREPLEPLLASHHEFGELARLVRDSFAQEAEMREEVARRRSSEVELARVCRESEDTAKKRMRMLAQASHEIRSPLAGVVGMVDLLADTRLDDQQREFVGTIQSTARSLIEVLNDVLDLSKIEQGKLVLEQIEFELRPLVESVVALFATQAQSKGIEIGQIIPESCPDLVRGDPGRVRQILINLVGNAVKYTERGEIAIEVGTTRDSHHATSFYFTVRDTGAGVPPDRIRAIFEEYEQASASDARVHGGTGLGLAICRHLAKMLGGTLEVQSEVGKGSAFTLTIPLFVIDATKVLDERSLGVFVVLRVEQALTRAALAAQVRSIGCEVQECVDESGMRKATAERAARSRTIVIAEYRKSASGSFADFVQKTTRALEGTNVPLVVVATVSEALAYTKQNNNARVTVVARPVTSRALREAIFGSESEERVEREPGPESKQVPVEVALAGKRVLIAESYPPTQRLLSDQARQLGLDVVLAVDGRVAFETLTSESFDAAVVDLRLVGIDGLELARMLRAHEGEHEKSRLPIIALNAPARDQAKWKAVGIDDAVRGTLTATTLGEALKRALGVSTTAAASP